MLSNFSCARKTANAKLQSLLRTCWQFSPAFLLGASNMEKKNAYCYENWEILSL